MKKSNPKQTVQTTTKIVKKETTPKPGKKAGKRQKRARRRGQGPNSSFLVTTTLRHKELWSVIHFDANSSNVVNKLNFEEGTYPPWFNEIRKLYEMYQIHYLRIFTKSAAATTTNGRYVLSYNTNESQKSDARSTAQLSAQQNAAESNVFKQLSVVIPASSLKNFRTNTPCSGTNSWAFNVEVGMDGNNIALDVPVWVEYKVTMRNPQI